MRALPPLYGLLATAWLNIIGFSFSADPTWSKPSFDTSHPIWLKLPTAEQQQYALFGYSIDLSDKVTYVGSPGYDDLLGAVFKCPHSTATWKSDIPIDCQKLTLGK